MVAQRGEELKQKLSNTRDDALRILCSGDVQGRSVNCRTGGGSHFTGTAQSAAVGEGMKKNDPLQVLACQIDIPTMTCVAERDAHLERSAALVRASLTDAPVDLVVLPELSSLDYSRAAFENLGELAEPLEGASFQTWRLVAQAHQCHVAYGFARSDGARRFITIAVVGPDGTLLGYYDKIHLAQFGASMEKEYFSRGDKVFTFEINGFRISPIICYDIRIPELSRVLVVEHGVDLILHCGAYYRDASFATWHAFATTRAIENQVYFLSLNRAGEQYGQSLFCLPWMDEATRAESFAPHDEDIRRLRLDRATIDDARMSYSFLKDRRADYSLD